MVFSSPIFVFIFLPSIVLLYYALLYLDKKHRFHPAILIFAGSLVYYSWWRIDNVWVILTSILMNYLIGNLILNEKHKKFCFILGIAFNVGMLGYYKYTGFAIATINSISGASFSVPDIILPIGISFFSFQQLAYISDCYTGKYRHYKENFIDYCCFVCFFPQLVAGPIVHHQEMMPQFNAAENQRVKWDNIFNGLVMFSIGLAKKVLIADQISPIASICFDTLNTLTFLDAMTGSLCYTLQLYFDFSGYCDMAIGCALFFNIKLPLNFDSPYKSGNIQEFWHRWHITLSRWLRDYLYIPLGGNRKGSLRTYGNLFFTFVIGGLWHGASWTFIVWGAMHGITLVMHRAWKKIGIALPYIIGWLLTFLFVNIAWIVFRAKDISAIKKFYHGLIGYNGYWLSDKFIKAIPEYIPSTLILFVFISICLAIIFFAPNSSKIIMASDNKKLFLSVILSLFAIIFMCMPGSHPEFIYSQF